MVKDPVTLETGSSLREATLKLSNGGFHALPVVDQDRTLIGIVTSSDLIEHLLHQLPTNDGSLRVPALDTASSAAMSNDDANAAVAAAGEALARGEDNPLARAVLDRARGGELIDCEIWGASPEQFFAAVSRW